MAASSLSKDDNGFGNHDRLTRRNLESYTMAMRREDAHRRGRSTPSSEPDLHEYNSLDSRRLSRELKPPPMTAEQRAADKEAGRVLRAWFLRNEPERHTSPQPPPTDNEAAEITAALERPASDPRPGMAGSRIATRKRRRTANQTDRVAADHKGASGTVNGEKGTETQRSETHIARETDVGPGRSNYPIVRSMFDFGLYGDVKQPPQPSATHNTRRPQHQPSMPRPHLPQPSMPGPRLPRPSMPGPRLPPDFPEYHSTQNMNEIAAYLANASYVISLGGPPLADLKYGIIVVPVGEESLLLGPRPDQAMSREFLDAVDEANRDYDREQHMRDPDTDSDEFLRFRFDDDFPSRPTESHQHIEMPPPRKEKVDSKPKQTTIPSAERRSRHSVGVAQVVGRNGSDTQHATATAGLSSNTRDGPITSDRIQTRSSIKGVATRAHPSRPQGIAKTRGSPRKRGPVFRANKSSRSRTGISKQV